MPLVLCLAKYHWTKNHKDATQICDIDIDFLEEIIDILLTRCWHS